MEGWKARERVRERFPANCIDTQQILSLERETHMQVHGHVRFCSHKCGHPACCLDPSATTQQNEVQRINTPGFAVLHRVKSVGSRMYTGVSHSESKWSISNELNDFELGETRTKFNDKKLLIRNSCCCSFPAEMHVLLSSPPGASRGCGLQHQWSGG